MHAASFKTCTINGMQPGITLRGRYSKATERAVRRPCAGYSVPSFFDCTRWPGIAGC